MAALRRRVRSGAEGSAQIDATEYRAALKHLQGRRNLPVVAIFGDELCQSLDVAARCRRERPDQGVEQRSIDRKPELLGHDAPYLPARLVVRRRELDQR